MLDYTGKIIYLGIDVHKASYSVAAICDGVVVKRDKLKASPKILLEYCRKAFKGAAIKSAYEAGFSGFHLHRFLIENSISNIVVHAASIEISSRDQVKTDKRDALKIATQLSTNRLSCIYIPSRQREDKRNLTRLREKISRQKSRTACQLKSLLHLHGLIPYDHNPKACVKWLEHLKQLKMMKNLQYSVQTYSQIWLYFDEQLKLVAKEIAQEEKDDAWMTDIYRSIPGIGLTSARILLNELEDTSQFPNENALFSYAGLTPKEHSSGEHRRQGNISKQGKPIMRKILVQCAWKAIKRDLSLSSIFEKLSLRIGKKRAIVAVARIMLGRIRSCMKRKGRYVVLVPKSTSLVVAEAR